MISDSVLPERALPADGWLEPDNYESPLQNHRKHIDSAYRP